MHPSNIIVSRQRENMGKLYTNPPCAASLHVRWNCGAIQKYSQHTTLSAESFYL